MSATDARAQTARLNSLKHFVENQLLGLQFYFISKSQASKHLKHFSISFAQTEKKTSQTRSRNFYETQESGKSGVG